MIFWNRENIALVNQIKTAHGRERTAQTNSRFNGNFGVVRLYQKPEHKGKIALAVELETPEQMRAWLKAHGKG